MHKCNINSRYIAEIVFFSLSVRVYLSLCPHLVLPPTFITFSNRTSAIDSLCLYTIIWRYLKELHTNCYLLTDIFSKLASMLYFHFFSSSFSVFSFFFIIYVYFFILYFWGSITSPSITFCIQRIKYVSVFDASLMRSRKWSILLPALAWCECEIFSKVIIVNDVKEFPNIIQIDLNVFSFPVDLLQLLLHSKDRFTESSV